MTFPVILLLLLAAPASGQYLADCRHWKNTSADSLCRYARLARQQAETGGSKSEKALSLSYCAQCLLLQARTDSAQLLLDAAFGVLKDSARMPEVYEQLGQMQVLLLQRSNKYKDAIAASLRYLAFAETRQDTLFQIVFCNFIGAAHMRMLQKQEALDWYRKGLSVASDTGWIRRFPVIYGNLGITFVTMSQWDSAERYARLAIRYERDSQNYSGLAGVLPAMGAVYMETHREKLAAAPFLECVEAARRLNDPYMILAADVSSATYLGKTGEYRKSVGLCQAAIDLARRYQLATQLPYLYQTVAEDYKSEGDFKDYSIALEQLAALKDSTARRNSSATIADLQMKYELQKKENTIMRQQYELGQKNFWIYGGFILSAVIALFALLLIRVNRSRHRYRMALTVKDAEEKERQRVAAELHDDMGTRINILSHAASRLMEVSPDIGSRIKETSNDLMQSLRETVWTLKQESILSSDVWVRFKNFVFKMRDAYSGVRFDILESDCRDRKLPYREALHLIRILQEAAGNAVKHSGCTALICEKRMDGDSILFSITDNGKGFWPGDESHLQGNGIFNMRQRAEESKFVFVLSAEPGKGCRIEVKL